MTEKETLELAAKKAGITGVYNARMNAIEIDTTHLGSLTRECVYWRPIREDAILKDVK